MDSPPHSCDLRRFRRMDSSGTWFVTKCLEPKQPILLQGGAAKLIVEALEFSVARERILLGAFVVMPDHWHALLATSRLPKLMHSVDTWIGSKSTKLFAIGDTAWQDSYHDTRIKSMRQFLYVRRYIEDNPVRRQLCDSCEEWPWSSANPDFSALVTREWPWDFEQDHVCH